jgi:hypothetical protein
VSVRQLLAWLGVEHTREAQESTPLRELIETLDRLEPGARAPPRALRLSARTRGARRSPREPEETRAMEALVVREGGSRRIRRRW